MVWTQQQAPVAKRSVSDFTPPFLKLAPGKGITKRSSQQGSQRGGGGDQGPGMSQQPQRREIRLQHSSMQRIERVEDPNVWKPKHAVKSKEEDPEEVKTQVSRSLIFHPSFTCFLYHLVVVS